jgi:hypothetical protein
VRRAFLSRERQPDASWRVAATPARGVMVWRDFHCFVPGSDPVSCGETFTVSLQGLTLLRVGHENVPHRMPPRSWWARKKFSDPAVAIAAEAEISSARVAAATICAKR